MRAWLETDVIGAKARSLDMASFGPQLEAPHSPDERVNILTVERFWRLLTGVVDDLSRMDSQRSRRLPDRPGEPTGFT